MTNEPKKLNGRKIASSANGVGKTGSPFLEELNPYLSPCIKINCKWIKDLNLKPETLKEIEESGGSNLQDISIGKDFLNQTAAAQEIRSTAGK